MEVSFFLPGDIVAKARPRGGANGAFYTPGNTRDYEDYVQVAGYKAMNGRKLMAGALECKLDFVYRLPKSVKKDARYKITKPDLDNLQKSVLDGLNNICYEDDRQIVKIDCQKIYGDTPGVKIFLKEIE